MAVVPAARGGARQAAAPAAAWQQLVQLAARVGSCSGRARWLVRGRLVAHGVLGQLGAA